MRQTSNSGASRRARRDRELAAVVRRPPDGREGGGELLAVDLDVERHGLPAREVREPRHPERRLADPALEARAHALDDGGVEPDAGHQQEVAARGCGLVEGEAGEDLARRAAGDGRGGALRVEGEFQLAREDVRRARREDAEPRVRPDDRLQRLVDRAVAAGDDNLSLAAGDRLMREARRVFGRARQRELGLEAPRLKQGAEAFEFLRAGAPAATRVRVRDQDDLATVRHRHRRN
ncbi:MAG TPA: hypothetical protein VM864_06250 [Pyrinomonadaceae bacterium]|nr:hypothetical protein [Pyrinomonadaceae bacterium]